MAPDPRHFDSVEPARRVCAGWFGARSAEFGPALGGGFSGASLFRVRPHGSRDWFVLKAFAAGTPRDRAAWVHGLARHLAEHGIAAVPTPQATPTGDTLVTDADGVHWELVPFVAGAVRVMPMPQEASVALETLARLHLAAATLPDTPPRVGPSPGAARRIRQAQELAARPWRTRRRDVVAADPLVVAACGRWDHACAIYDEANGDRAVANVARAAPEDLPLQAVLRDVWSDHVLFAAGPQPRVAGIVDLHAASVDTPATDIARLLGSWRREAAPPAADPASTWPEAVAAYGSIRDLTVVERRLIPWLHATGVLCGLDNWFRWICEESRSFVQPHAAIGRIDRLLEDLPPTLEFLARGTDCRV